jgi:hypothetical protein
VAPDERLGKEQVDGERVDGDVRRRLQKQFPPGAHVKILKIFSPKELATKLQIL